nr:immunoglobulin heavy chain junction region [Mus musculus]
CARWVDGYCFDYW